MRNYSPLLFKYCWLVLAVLLAGCEQQQPVQIDGLTMGTTYSVQLHEIPTGMQAAGLQTQLELRLANIIQQMSTYEETSDISRFNQQQSNDWYSVSPEFVTLVAIAEKLSRDTQGAFDITIGPLVELWGFGSRITAHRPTDTQIQAMLEQVGHGRLEWRQEPSGIRKQIGELQIDLSALAKGYGVDVLSDYLSDIGVQDYLVEIGGELRASGVNLEGQSWQIGVQQPDSDQSQAVVVVTLNDQAIATSGDYLNFYIEDGQRYSHIIDPRSGYPTKHQTTSVTVVAANTAVADAWATALLVMGENEGLVLANKHSIAAIFMTRQTNNDLSLVISAEMQQFLD